MKEIIFPDIKMIYDIKEELRQDPVHWAMYLSIAHCVATNYSKDVVVIKQKLSEGHNGDQLMIIMKQVDRLPTYLGAYARDKEVGNKLYIKVELNDDEYFYLVEGNSLFESLDVVTDESLEHDLRLIKIIKNPSDKTIKLFEEQFIAKREEEVKIRHKIDKSKLEQAARGLYNSLFDINRRG